MGRRLATLLCAVLQLAIALAPHVSSYADASAHRPHLHAVGDQLEIGHDELACPSCSGVRLVATGSKPVLETIPEVTFVPPGQAHEIEVSFDYTTTSLSRAPPSVV